MTLKGANTVPKWLNLFPTNNVNIFFFGCCVFPAPNMTSNIRIKAYFYE